jgi:DNA modification methylase
MIEKLKWKTEKRKVKDLIPYEKNPRKLSDEQKKALKESLEKFGLVEIPAINTDNKIIAGHQRIMILLLLGRGNEEIDVRIPNRKLNEDEFKEYLLRSNKNVGDWDFETLLKDFDNDILLKSGFEEEELGDMWDDMNDIMEDGFNLNKALREIKEPKTRIGDLYQLGNHKLLVGDSTESHDVEKLMGNEKADMIYSDPPYNIGLDYNKGIGTDKKYKGEKEFYKLNDKKKDSDYEKFIDLTIINSLNHLKKNAHIFYWCDENYIYLIQNLYKQNRIKTKRVCLWIKNNFNCTPQTAFNKVYEPCVYGTIGKPYLNKNINNLSEIMNKEIGTGNQIQDEIYSIFNVWLSKRDNTQEYEHPTQKPLTLHERPLKRCSKPRDIILDLFGGSGSTLIACEQLNRRARLIEIDPIFADVIINRWESYTGRKAEKLEY